MEKYMCLNRIGSFPACQVSWRSGSTVFRVTANDTQRKKSQLEFKWRSCTLWPHEEGGASILPVLMNKLQSSQSSANMIEMCLRLNYRAHILEIPLSFWPPEEGQRKASPNTFLSLYVLLVLIALFNGKMEKQNAVRSNHTPRFLTMSI